MDAKDKSVENNSKGKSTGKDFSTLSPIIKCYKCQGYVHVAANCSSSVIISINKLLVMDLEPDFEVFIYQVEVPESSDSNEKTTCDNIVESST